MARVVLSANSTRHFTPALQSRNSASTSACSLSKLTIGKNSCCWATARRPSSIALTSSQLFQNQPSHFSGSNVWSSMEVSFHSSTTPNEKTPHLWLLHLVNPPTRHKQRDIMLPALLKHVVGHSDNPLGADDEASLFQRLALSAGERGLAKVEMPAGELPVSWINSVAGGGGEMDRVNDSPTP